MTDIKLLKRQHLEAFEASLNNQTKTFKVYSGTYYYRGVEITKEGYYECPWLIIENTRSIIPIETLKAAKETIDTLKIMKPNFVTDMEWVKI